MIKKLLLIVALAVPMFASAQTLKMAIVDVEDIFQSLPDTENAKTELAKVSKMWEDELANMQAEFKSLYEAYQALGADTPDAIRERKARDLEEKNARLQQVQQQAYEELQKKQMELQQPIMMKINNAVQSVGQEGAYSMIQMKNPENILYFAAPVEDITPLVKAKLGIK